MLLAVLAPVLAGWAVGWTTAAAARDDWYRRLRKPRWTPPSWAFGPVWTVLYASMGYAAWRVWRAGGRGWPVALFAAQMALNLAWSPLFFVARDLTAAAVDVGLLWAAVVAMGVTYARYDAAAAWLTLPYAAWVSLATALTVEIRRGETSG